MKKRRKVWVSEVPCLAASSLKPVAEWVAVRRHFGWERMWRCGVCGRRVRYLYWRNERWACRKCQDLRYEVCYRPLVRYRNRLERLLRRLDGGKRPKWMHAATYLRLRNDIARTYADLEFHTLTKPLAALLKRHNF